MTPESTPTWLLGPEIPSSARIGTVLSGTYRLDAFLGDGQTGISYNAWHLRHKIPFAVKLIQRELAPTLESVSRLRQDLRILAGLSRHGFLPVELSFAPDGTPFLAGELLVGETLRQRLGRGPMPSLAAGIAVAALARALAQAHRLGVVHGDLRPENVMLPTMPGTEVDAGQPVLLDAALHHLRRRPIGLDESLPLSKLSYLAPEQASGEATCADVPGDVFALGAILYECLSGQQAFGASEIEVVLEKLARPPRPLQLPREVGAPPGLAEALDVVIAGACARDPGARIESMEALLTALAQAYAGVELPLPPPEERLPVAGLFRGRRSTVAQKKVVPLRAPSQGDTASTGSYPEIEIVVEQQAVPPPPPRPTARSTVRARDISKLLREVQSGRLDAQKAVELAGSGEPVPGETTGPQKEASEEERIAEAGRAAVLARAEAERNAAQAAEARRQRRAAEAEAAAQEAKRRVLDAARAEVLTRIRAEMDEKDARERGAPASPPPPPPQEPVPAPVMTPAPAPVILPALAAVTLPVPPQAEMPVRAATGGISMRQLAMLVTATAMLAGLVGAASMWLLASPGSAQTATKQPERVPAPLPPASKGGTVADLAQQPAAVPEPSKLLLPGAGIAAPDLAVAGPALPDASLPAPVPQRRDPSVRIPPFRTEEDRPIEVRRPAAPRPQPPGETEETPPPPQPTPEGLRDPFR